MTSDQLFLRNVKDGLAAISPDVYRASHKTVARLLKILEEERAKWIKFNDLWDIDCSMEDCLPQARKELFGDD